MMSNPGVGLHFRSFAMVRARAWVEPLPGGAPRYSWLFLMNGGLASGHVEIDQDGVRFTPRPLSRARGMGCGFAPWSAIDEVGVLPRDGIFGACFCVLRLHERDNGLTISTFSMAKLSDVLHALAHDLEDFPTIEA